MTNSCSQLASTNGILALLSHTGPTSEKAAALFQAAVIEKSRPKWMPAGLVCSVENRTQRQRRARNHRVGLLTRPTGNAERFGIEPPWGGYAADQRTLLVRTVLLLIKSAIFSSLNPNSARIARVSAPYFGGR